MTDEPDERYFFPRILFVEYLPSGEIVMHGTMAVGFVDDLEAEGRLIIRPDVEPTADDRVNVDTKTIEPKPPCPATLDGHTLSNIPIPSRVSVNGEVHEVDDGELEIEIVTPGVYPIVVENPLYLTGYYEVSA